jgi:hypothetical protein
VISPAAASAIVASVCVAVAIGFALAGVLRVAREGLTLKARVERYADLPLRRYVERTQIQLATAQHRADGVPMLLYRASSAIAEIEAARDRLRAIATSASTLARLASVILLGR